jgi:hypothetical protein
MPCFDQASKIDLFAYTCATGLEERQLEGRERGLKKNQDAKNFGKYKIRACRKIPNAHLRANTEVGETLTLHAPSTNDSNPQTSALRPLTERSGTIRQRADRNVLTV